jgi:NAD(P)-dependent dehydrogenase (short-subunit alcohol dehydrogenase family)
MMSGKVVVVTGASAGIGRATALAFARQGADVGLIARNEARLDSARKEIEALGRRALVLPLDVADGPAMESAADRIETTLGPIDVWISNAMVSVFSPVSEMTPDEFRRVTEVTYLGSVYGVLAALKRMRPRNRGSIVIVGSALAYRGIPLQSAYCAAKHALKGFHESLRSELEHDRSSVRVTMVQLSAFNTPQFDWSRSRMTHRARPMGPVFQPELAAQAILWAARHARREVTVGFPALKAIWASKLFPSLVDHHLARSGYSGQQADEPKDSRSPENLWHSVPGPYGAHGRFDEAAKSWSLQFWLRSLLP